MSDPMLTLAVTGENLFVSTMTPSQRYVEWTVKAGKLPNAAERAPLNLALVIDRSGSMDGTPLAYAKQAAIHVTRMLDEKDRVAVIALTMKFRSSPKASW